MLGLGVLETWRSLAPQLSAQATAGFATALAEASFDRYSDTLQNVFCVKHGLVSKVPGLFE